MRDQSKRGRFNSWAGFLGVALVLGGCVRQPQVQVDELPVRRVVVYRNGVAYFERAGQVEGEQVKFRLREENVGDFLATLAILERGGSSVRSASFPVELEAEAEAPSDPAIEAALDAWEGKKADRRSGLRVVTLELDGEEHELTVGYLAETPVWRPSYRLVVGEKGRAELQAWGIVQNQSGEDWKDVQISLVAGAPIAFESTLGDPVIPRRPIVTDNGEVIVAVPEGSSSYHGAEAPEEEDASEQEGYGYSFEGSAVESLADRDDRAYPAAAPAPSRGASASTVKKAAPPLAGVGQVRPTVNLAQIATQTGSTRYELPHTVTIPDQSATMVLLISQSIPGEASYLFAPDIGVPDSYRHPFRVARFKNESGGLLERGPIAVFEKGAFLGQGLLEPLPERGSATVPFALVRGLSVQLEHGSDQRDSRLYSVARGEVTLERDFAQLTTYKVQNGEKEDVRLLVKHPRNGQARLHNPPAGTEEDASSGSALIPVQVRAHGQGSLVVEERYPVQQRGAWGALDTRQAIEAYLASGAPSAQNAELLRKVLQLSQGLAKVDEEETRLRREQQELEKSARETRLSITAIEKNQSAATLRAELTTRLQRTTARLDVITKELIELGLNRSEQEVRLKEATQNLVIPPPDQRK